ncbi:MAG: endo alpha-1,4 polygalactosaminidase [Thermoleophilia bacterium]|nr:endo alpha-1,4 polygalactosaminidase [Thermoleophilia bacterium]
MPHRERDNTKPGRRPAQKVLLACIFLAVCAGLGMRPSTASASPRNPRLVGVSSFAFGIGDGMLDGNIAKRFAGYDLVIVDGDLVTAHQIAALHATGAVVLGYLDVGTIESGRPWYHDVEQYRMELWDDWGEWYADVRQPGFQRVIAGKVAPQMLAKGFDGLFLDNTDMVEGHPAQRGGMRRLVRLLARQVHSRDGVLFAQNGAESVAAIAPLLDGWNREDVTSTYDFDTHRYIAQTAADVGAAQKELRAMARRGLLTMATDYTATGQGAPARRATANACRAGAVSFVSDIGLTRMPAAPPTCPTPRAGRTRPAANHASRMLRAPRCPVNRHVTLARPAVGSAYVGAYPNFSDATHNEDGVSGSRIVAFEQLAGRPIAWSYFSNHWTAGHIVFPRAAVMTTWRHGAMPFVRMMPWSRQLEDHADPLFRMRDIAAGRWDAPLRLWARSARATGVPIMVDFGVEMNGSWFPWNGRWQGGPDVGPRAYRAAYRHIVTIFRTERANNVSFAFHIDADSQPDAAWNAPVRYYPGDQYIDWIGASVYGAVDTGETWEPFSEKLDRGLAELRRVSTMKPVAIFEWGVVESPAQGTKSQWVDDAFTSLRTQHPQVAAISWWNERWQQPDSLYADTRIDSSAGALAAYRAGIADPHYIDTPTFACVR